jgi:hypothetical protein
MSVVPAANAIKHPHAGIASTSVSAIVIDDRIDQKSDRLAELV